MGEGAHEKIWNKNYCDPHEDADRRWQDPYGCFEHAQFSCHPCHVDKDEGGQAEDNIGPVPHAHEKAATYCVAERPLPHGL